MLTRKIVINTGSWFKRPDKKTIQDIMTYLPDGRIVGFGQDEPSTLMGFMGGPGCWYILVESSVFTQDTMQVLTTSQLRAHHLHKAPMKVVPPPPDHSAS